MFVDNSGFKIFQKQKKLFKESVQSLYFVNQFLSNQFNVQSIE